MKLINPLIILRILSTITLIATISFLFCLPVAFINREPVFPFILSPLITVIISVALYIASNNVDMKRISNRDGYLAVTLSWTLLSLAGTLPYLISGTIPSFINAFFESTSGFSTTGSSVVTDVEALPMSILFWRSLTHWMGGIGIILLVIIVLPSLRISGYQLFTLESSIQEKIHPKTTAIGLRILLLYVGLTVAQIVILSFGDMNIFESICHSFSTISTGGFSVKNSSLAHYSAYSQYVVLIFMFLAGTSQVVYYYLLKRNFRKVKHNEELLFYFATAIIAGALASSILLINTTKTPEQAIREGYFQIVSMLTTTGFSSADFDSWPRAGILVVFVIMFAGGCTGSTSGGIKMARHLVVLKNIKNALTKLNHPNMVTAIKLNGKVIGENANISILSFIVLYLFIFVVGTVVVVATGVDPVSASSSVASCMAGVGPGIGSVGPASNFAGLPEVSKVVLSMVMIIGRLEIVTVFVIFSRSFWKL